MSLQVGDKVYEAVSGIFKGDPPVIIREYEVMRVGKTVTLYPEYNYSSRTDPRKVPKAKSPEEAMQIAIAKAKARIESALESLRLDQEHLKQMETTKYPVLTVEGARQRIKEDEERRNAIRKSFDTDSL